MSESTPNMNTIRHAWVKAHPFPLTTDVEERYAEFDRALTAHDAEMRAEIYREAARFLRSSDNPRQGDRTLACVSYTMDDAGYELFQRAKQIDGA